MSLEELGKRGAYQYTNEGFLLQDWQNKTKQLREERDIIENKLKQELLKIDPTSLEPKISKQLRNNIEFIKNELQEKQNKLDEARQHVINQLNYFNPPAYRSNRSSYDVANRSRVPPVNPIKGGKKRKTRKNNKKGGILGAVRSQSPVLGSAFKSAASNIIRRSPETVKQISKEVGKGTFENIGKDFLTNNKENIVFNKNTPEYSKKIESFKEIPHSFKPISFRGGKKRKTRKNKTLKKINKKNRK